MDIKSHTIVRGHNSAINVANRFVADTSQDVSTSRNMVTRSNSLRRVESPPNQRHPNLSRLPSNVPESTALDITNGNYPANVNNFNNGKFATQVMQQQPQNNIQGHGVAQMNANLNPNAAMYGHQPQPLPVPNNMSSMILNSNVNNLMPNNRNVNASYQIPPNNGILGNKNLSNMAMNGQHQQQMMFNNNKARYGMLPQPQQPQFASNSNMASSNAFAFSAPANHNGINGNHPTLPQPQQQQQFKIQPQQISPNSYPQAPLSQSLQYSKNNHQSEHPNPANFHGNSEQHQVNNNNIGNVAKPNSNQQYLSQVNQNFANLSIKPHVNGQVPNQLNGNHGAAGGGGLTPTSHQSSPSSVINQVQQQQQQPTTHSHPATHLKANGLASNLTAHSNGSVNGNQMNSTTVANSNSPHGGNAKSAAHSPNTQPMVNNNGAIASLQQQQQMQAGQGIQGAPPQVPPHAQQRVTHEQFRAALQMVVNPGDPRYAEWRISNPGSGF